MKEIHFVTNIKINEDRLLFDQIRIYLLKLLVRFLHNQVYSQWAYFTERVLVQNYFNYSNSHTPEIAILFHANFGCGTDYGRLVNA